MSRPNGFMRLNPDTTYQIRLLQSEGRVTRVHHAHNDLGAVSCENNCPICQAIGSLRREFEKTPKKDFMVVIDSISDDVFEEMETISMDEFEREL